MNGDSQSKYNPEQGDYFNSDLKADFQPITEDKVETALSKIDELVGATWKELKD